MSRHAVAAALQTVAPAGLAVVAFLLLTVSPVPWLGYAMLCLTLAVGWAAARPPALGTDIPTRVLLAAGVLGHAAQQAVVEVAFLVIAGSVLLGALLAEGLLRRLARPWFHARHLSAASPRTPAALVDNGVAWLVNSGAVALAGLAGVLVWPAWTLLLPATGAAAFAGWLLADGWRRWRTGHRAELSVLTREVTRHRPRFLLYFSAPPGSEYQARMWLPYLERVGVPFLVVVPERHNLAPVAAATRAPVIAYDTLRALDAVMVPSLRAAFYVNNGMKNAHCLRYARLSHVQLYHGYSYKPVSVNPLAAVFDLIYVPGQAIADQFSDSGPDIPKERFRIVGRPQAEELQVATRHISEVGDLTVLYAPTWAGEYADSNLCSLPIAETIVSGLLTRGVTVIVRPHPYTRRNPQTLRQLRRVERLLARDPARGHLWGAAVARMSLTDCMNRADAMICDVSSVASEFLYTAKPLAITDMATGQVSLTESLPLARGAYVIRHDAGNLADLLDDLLVRDPRAENRRDLRTYYLGDFPAERYAEGFLAEARRCIAT